MYPVPQAFDVVITTNSGYPLDQNLYQTVKGMSAAFEIVRPGGAILTVSECSDGIPSHGNFGEILKMRDTPEALLQMIEDPSFSLFDQWEAQKQAMIQTKADCYLYSSLDKQTVAAAKLHYVADLALVLPELMAKYGKRVAVMPLGPLTIPYVAG